MITPNCTVDRLRELLQTGVVVFKFLKKDGTGTIRTAVGTTNPDIVMRFEGDYKKAMDLIIGCLTEESGHKFLGELRAELNKYRNMNEKLSKPAKLNPNMVSFFDVQAGSWKGVASFDLEGNPTAIEVLPIYENQQWTLIANQGQVLTGHS